MLYTNPLNITSTHKTCIYGFLHILKRTVHKFYNLNAYFPCTICILSVAASTIVCYEYRIIQCVVGRAAKSWKNLEVMPSCYHTCIVKNVTVSIVWVLHMKLSMLNELMSSYRLRAILPNNVSIFYLIDMFRFDMSYMYSGIMGTVYSCSKPNWYYVYLTMFASFHHNEKYNLNYVTATERVSLQRKE